MKRAVISDIHANLEALQAVLEDIRTQGVTKICCLGDIVGYGPDPCECLDIVLDCADIVILGNHDQAVQFDPDGFNPVALQAVYWTREQMEKRDRLARNTDQKLFDRLDQFQRLHRAGDYLFVHGSPREPTNEYVFPEDVYNQRKMVALFDRIERYCFQGHTHIPGVFPDTGDFIAAHECDHRYPLKGTKAMFNVGSVGQPRDNDSRACYAIIHDDIDDPMVEFRRVPYPLEVTVKKIYAVSSLDNMLGDRLRSGR